MPHSTEYVKITGFSARRRLSRQVLSPGPSSRCSSHTSAASVGSLIDKPTCWIQLASASEQKTSCILTSLKHPQRSGSAMGDQRELAHISGTANDSAPMGYHLSKPIKHEAQLHQEGKSSLAGAGHAPQQADLQQVMQDVNGRFIANVATQLHKRAASLCYQELKEYKRSKKLNILTAPKAEAAGSQPSSASYLIPALPRCDPAACSSEPSPRHDPCGKSSPVFEQGLQASAAQARSDPDCKASLQAASSSSPPLANGVAAQMPASDKHALSKQPGSLQTDSEPTHTFNGMQGSSAAHKAAEPMPVPAATPSTDVSSHGPASQPAKPGVVRLCTDKQQWSHLPKHQGVVPSWSQNGSQHAHQWERTTSQDFAQAKLTCTPRFPFSKQPCVVMW